MPPRAEPPPTFTHAYWGLGTPGLSPGRQVWVCDQCGLPAQVTVGDRGVPYVACPVHGRLAIPPGMTSADITAVRAYADQLDAMVQALRSFIDLVEESIPKPSSTQTRLGGD